MVCVTNFVNVLEEAVDPGMCVVDDIGVAFCMCFCMYLILFSDVSGSSAWQELFLTCSDRKSLFVQDASTHAHQQCIPWLVCHGVRASNVCLLLWGQCSHEWQILCGILCVAAKDATEHSAQVYQPQVCSNSSIIKHAAYIYYCFRSTEHLPVAVDKPTWVADGIQVMEPAPYLNFVTHSIAQLVGGIVQQMPAHLQAQFDCNKIIESVTIRDPRTGERIAAAPWELGPGMRAHEDDTRRQDLEDEWRAYHEGHAAADVLPRPAGSKIPFLIIDIDN